MRNSIRAAIAATALAVSAVGVTAGPAFAAGPTGGPYPITANATVSSAISITGLTSTVTFGTGVPGATVGTTPATTESYNVVSNDVLGFQVDITNGAGVMSDGASHTIPDGAIKVVDSPGTTNFLSAATTVLATHGPTTGTFPFTDTWSLAIPAGTPGGTYTQTDLAYQVVGN